MKKLVSLFCFYSSLYAQNPIVLDSVIVTDTQSKWLSAAEAPLVMSRDEVRHNNASLARLFEFSYPVQMRHNGSGGVASMSFRGTSPQQTVVLWNGVPVNSAFNGQGDYAAIPVYGFDQVRIQSGGGSVLYGSNAIGGSVHLDNKLRFNQAVQNDLHLTGGSFGSVGGQYEIRGGSHDFAFQGTLSHQQSDHDFEVRDFVNRNADSKNHGINLALGYRINARHFLSFYNQVFASNRHFPIWLASDSRAGYKELNQRNMVQWSAYGAKSQTRVKAAYLVEEYEYFPNRYEAQSDFGQARNTWLQLWHEHALHQKWDVDVTAEFQQTSGKGSDIDTRSQQNVSVAAMAKYKWSPHLWVQAGVRQEISALYESPLLYSGRISYQSQRYSLGFSVAKNFRMPSFNERYWRLGGNPDLLPESALQFELTQRYRHNAFVFGGSIFQNRVKEMIQWIPISGIHWEVLNAHDIEIYGASAEIFYNQSRKAGPISAEVRYAYTRAMNVQTNKQLLYVPEHHLTSRIAYRWKRVTLISENALKGLVHTRSDNDLKAALRGYWLSNAIIAFAPKDGISLRAQCRNVFDEYYFSMENRPMPGRHYEFSIHYTFL